MAWVAAVVLPLLVLAAAAARIGAAAPDAAAASGEGGDVPLQLREFPQITHIRSAAVLARRYLEAAGLEPLRAAAAGMQRSAQGEAPAGAHDIAYDRDPRERAREEYFQRRPAYRAGAWSPKTVALLERRLFPWLRAGVRGLRYAGRGIVMTTGDRYFAMAVHLIRSIREVHGCDLPVELFYMGPADLADAHVAHFASMERVRVVDICGMVDGGALRLSGWDVKPFALLLSSFEQALFLDADAVLFKSPESFFHDVDYARTGALFFYDRHIFWRNDAFAGWLRSILPELSEHVRETPVYRGEASHHQESGVVLVHKARVLGGLLMTCMLNVPGLREEVHAHTHGDKETFWLGFEMVRAPYAFSAVPAGQLGLSQTAVGDEPPGASFEGLLCHNLVHLDARGGLWWMNDGMVVDKRAHGAGFRNVRPLLHKARAGGPGYWDMQSNGAISCIWGSVQVLDAPEQDVVARLAALWDPYPLGIVAAYSSSCRSVGIIVLGVVVGLAVGVGLVVWCQRRGACECGAK